MSRPFWTLVPLLIPEMSNPRNVCPMYHTKGWELLEPTELILILLEVLDNYRSDPRFREIIASLDRDKIRKDAEKFENFANR